MGTEVSGKAIDLREHKNGGGKIQEMADSGELRQCEDCTLEYAQKVSDDSLRALSIATGLTRLNLNACQDYTDDGLGALAKGCSSLTDLSLYWNVKIGDKGISSMVRNNTSLTKLSLSGCKRLTDEGAVEVAKSCVGLVSLDLTRCCALTDKALESIGQYCTLLEDLRFYACGGGFGDVGVGALARSLNRIQVLDLCGSSKLTDEVSINYLHVSHEKNPLRRFLYLECPRVCVSACI
jgi:F-box/leucine-rich repeat protein 2/20